MSYQNNATEKVFDFIVDRIKSREWKQDSKIWTEPVFCKELNVSRIAVRQAIEKLSTLGVLTKRQGSGTYVTNVDVSIAMSPIQGLLLLTAGELIPILEFRKYFEYGNVIHFINNCTDEDIAELEKDYENMLSNVHDSEKFHEIDFSFHSTIAKGTRNPLIIKINEILGDILKNHQRTLYYSVGPQIGIEFHFDILKYIKKKDKVLASTCMLRHIEATIESYKGRLL